MKDIAQLALAVQLPDDETFTSFKGDANHSVVVQLQGFIDQDTLQHDQAHVFYMFGIGGVGKSHLLHASSTFAAQNGKTSLCLSCSELKNLSIEVLDGLGRIDLICLDDLEFIAGDDLWQQGIFDLFNRLVENNKKLLITGDQSANQLGITLPDLVSRIGWGYTEQVKALDDEEKITALQYRAHQRGLMLSDEVVKFLLNRLTRDMGSLIDTLDLLDKASIRQQRKITIPFIKQTIASLG
jgi:DnaA family protein